MENLNLDYFFKEYPFLNNKTITVALSGGADSVCLLYLLYNIKEKYNIVLKAAHLNHLIRGQEAFDDQHFCEDLCKKLNIPLNVKTVDVPKLKQKGESLELAARRLRYEFFDSLKSDYIATAHNKNDNAETIILNIIRGCGINGITGIPVIRKNYIRPLLYFKKCDILSFCKNNNIKFITDSTNLSNDYSRNKIRNLVFPVLEQINEGYIDNIERLSKLAKEDNNFLQEYTNNILTYEVLNHKLNITNVIHYNTAILNRVIKTFLENELLFTIDEKTLKTIVLKANTQKSFKLNILNNKFVVFKNGLLSVEEQPKEIEFLVSTNKINKFSKINTIDCDKIVGKLKQDIKREGDVLKLYKRPTKTLKKLFTEFKIPVNIRKNLPVLKDDNGIVWAYKIGTAERAMPQKTSKNILQITVEERYVNS